MFLPVKVKVDIKNVLKTIFSSKDENIEIELRFRKSDSLNINNIKEYLEENNYSKHEKITLDSLGKDLTGKDLRITKDNGKFYKTTKRSIYQKIINLENLSLKLSIGSEQNEEIKEKPVIINELTRKKERITYTKNNLQVDITEVVETSETNEVSRTNEIRKANEVSRTELEIEVLDYKKFNFDDFDALAFEIYNIISFTDTDILEYISEALGKKTNSLSKVYNLISKPRDLEIKDLTKDGILKPFAISPKADGVQKFLLFDKTGIFLVDSKDNIDKISNSKSEKNSIYVGEYIQKQNIFLPFDTITHNNENVKDKDYLTRYNFCKTIPRKINQLIVQEKPIFVYQNTVKSFNETIIEVFDVIDKSNFNSDGIMFTPIESGYVADGQNQNIDKRILSKFNDVCKYKKEDDLTIDFFVKDNSLWSFQNGQLVKANFVKFDKIDAKYKNKIVEFKPVEIDKNIIYKPIRIREDKTEPNALHVALKLANLRKDPILEDTLKGKSMQLMRKYHNQIKERIIEKQSGFVIDIGGGHGGDIKKYNKNQKIIKVFSIEPQEDFIEQFKIRLQNPKFDASKFKIIKGGGEDTEKIIKHSSEFFKDVGTNNININFMISLSFFWKDRNMLESIANTIKKIKEWYSKSKVLINFLTIEGTRLEKLFDDRKTDKLNLNNVTLIRKENNKIYVDIKDSKTVHDQEEYLVKLDELWELINFYPLNLEEAIPHSEHDYILSENEITYSSLFVFGTAAYSNKPKKLTALFVDETKGVKSEKGNMALHDDEHEDFDIVKHKDLKRIATLKKHGSLFHSLLKLLNEKYRNGDVYTRIKMARDLSLKLDIDIESIAKKINYGIMIIEGTYEVKKYNQEAKRWIILYHTKDNEYEPIVYDDGKVFHYVFNDDSDLLEF